jgi:hypothetical protein
MKCSELQKIMGIPIYLKYGLSYICLTPPETTATPEKGKAERPGATRTLFTQLGILAA